MTASTLAVKDASGATQQLVTDLLDGKHTPLHHDADRPALLAALASILGSVDGLEALLSGNLAVTAAALPLPAGAATQATLASVLAKITASAATEAKQDAIKTSIDALTSAIKPITGHFLVVPSGTALANTTRRIVAGAAGTLTCTVGGASVSYTVTAGQALDVAATIISAAPAGTVGQY